MTEISSQDPVIYNCHAGMRQKPLLFQFLKDSLCDYVALASLSRLKQSLYRDNALISGDECCSFCVVDFMGLSHFINRGWLYPRCGFPWEWIFVGVLMWLTLAGIMSYNVRVTPGQVRMRGQQWAVSVSNAAFVNHPRSVPVQHNTPHHPS